MRTAVVCIARLEGKYLGEFIEYYKSLGFTNVILCDNDHDDDNEDVEGILKPYSGFVIYEDYRNKVGYQMRCYSEIYRKYKNEYDWLFFCDVDEYLTFTHHKNVEEFLQDKSDYECVMINWMCFGDNDQIYADYSKPLVERFPNPLPFNLCVQYSFPENTHIKSFIKGGLENALFQGNPHCTNTALKCCNASGMRVECRPWQNIDYSTAYLRHYITKSLEEYYLGKMKRGTGDRDYQSFVRFYANRYFQYNQVTDEKVNWLKEQGILKIC